MHIVLLLNWKFDAELKQVCNEGYSKMKTKIQNVVIKMKHETKHKSQFNW